MRPRAMKRAVVTLVLGASFFVGTVSCGSSKPTAQPAPVDLRGRKQVEIDAALDQFTPAVVIVDVGTKVTWRNNDAVAHNVEKSADALEFGAAFGADASRFGPGQTYSFTFTKAGTFFYTCTIHTLMSGKVDVAAGA